MDVYQNILNFLVKKVNMTGVEARCTDHNFCYENPNYKANVNLNAM